MNGKGGLSDSAFLIEQREYHLQICDDAPLRFYDYTLNRLSFGGIYASNFGGFPFRRKDGNSSGFTILRQIVKTCTSLCDDTISQIYDFTIIFRFFLKALGLNQSIFVRKTSFTERIVGLCIASLF
jgi:hypothetical protein